jgi:O-methyltransferase
MKKILILFYNLVHKIFDKIGYRLIIAAKKSKFNDYERVFPKATYSPWLQDTEFNEAYDVIKEYTLVDKYKCYELWQLIQESTKLKGAIIEVGVWKGGSAALIAKRAQLSDIQDNIYLCDTFTGVVKAGEKDSLYLGGEHADASKKGVQRLLKKLNLNNIKILEGIFPEETEKFVKDENFRFCHIDVDVYQSAKDIVEWIWPKLVTGGIIVFDDYGVKGCDGITTFVNEQRRKKDRLIIHNLNGHAIIIKIT